MINFRQFENSSTVGLKNLHDTVTRSQLLNCFKNLDEPTEKWGGGG